MRATTLRTLSVTLMAMAALTGCGQAIVDSEQLTAGDESGATDNALTAALPVGSQLRATANVNLRVGASTSAKVLLVVPNGSLVETVAAAPVNGFYNVKFNGTVGFSSGAYYTLVSSPSAPPPAASAARTAAIARARSGVGFSYWWGHARLNPAGPTSSTTGACYGTCPSCSHAGTFGADCSGFVGKIWQVGSNNTDLTVDYHPYSTASFNVPSSQWSNIDRIALKAADAMVYNNGSAGHIFLYESGDGWGSVWSYECRGCAEGCVHNLRTVPAQYHAIARAGY